MLSQKTHCPGIQIIRHSLTLWIWNHINDLQYYVDYEKTYYLL